MTPGLKVGVATGRRRVLLSSFACSPHWGSEPGVGWRWLEKLTQFHDVVLLTHGYFREHLQPLLMANPLPGLKTVYFSPPAFGAHPHRQLNSRLFYVWWQWCARRVVKGLLKTESIDLIHHLTWGTVRFPTFLGNLGVPLVMGPVGGGEVSPMRLMQGLPWSEMAFEWVRRVTLRWSRIDPLALTGPKASALVLCKTHETLAMLPPSVRSRCVVMPEIGAPGVDLSMRNTNPGTRPFKLLFAARLVGWKGPLLAINALRLLLDAGHDVVLEMAGEGPMRERLTRDIERLQLTQHVRLLGKLPRDSLLNLYGAADLLLFPSLHDSSGNVVLEALSRGVPVICLDLGGPKLFIDEQSGVVISTSNRSRQEVEAAMAHGIATLLEDPQRLSAMRRAASAAAAAQTWDIRVRTAYDLIESRLQWAPSR